ncbi:accessory gene regulator B family protein [Paenibacillus sp. GSMTC-2017]|uniref:accessory gene regulator B family protein n=1 Tax=Paenibacillus sp. GSMTC-2017 TaxID=2794350 RepID=UPI0018D7FDC7|nr:accessory gene regulator B family protein [Paenibacillus sp. GSMTC-2017]MBH5320092.1 accessory gene regulator B family protein [Paenibacillus sp. GSMTC-2017]
MQKQATVQMNVIESIADQVALWLNKERNGSHIDYLKMKLGIEIILTNLTTSVLIYGVALACNLVLQTLVLHSAYYAIRRVSFGLHASTRLRCSAVSIVLFVGTPMLGSYLLMNNLVVTILGSLLTLLLYRYAPADTDKFPLLGEERRRKLRRSSVITSILITLIALLCPNILIKSLLMIGLALQVIMILPITYKLLNRSVQNYEQYER